MRKVASFFFLATLFCCTFEKVHWNFGGQLALSDVLALCFIVAYISISRTRTLEPSSRTSTSPTRRCGTSVVTTGGLCGAPWAPTRK